MKKVFFAGLLGLLLFEAANVYFIMPMPGSQQMNSIDAAYFLYRYRWIFRVLFAVLMLMGLWKSEWKRKWVPFTGIAIAGMIIYLLNFKMAADAMFRQPKELRLLNAKENKVDSNRLVIGIEINGEAKAYPVQFIGYHHHLQDTVGGTPVLVTYCTVCRTGRVFSPFINGKRETFRLVGMDHFNAMLEDATTKSWWRQSTGKAIAGKLKGARLNELMSHQTSLKQWLSLHPNSLVMQADPAFINQYDSSFKYESGTSKSKLTGTDSSSWKMKSWVVGVKMMNNNTKAYDWNRLKKERMIVDTNENPAVLLVLANDEKSFFAYELMNADVQLLFLNDTITYNHKHFRINGKGIDTAASLKALPAYQEFWHSWQTFQPQTKK
ncbi:MAG: DUF3179 domain-containing protein [Chitinophagaceae bacterium]|nr:DUF3179 domain-containing protein [Chitinophagaceae bacterium]